MKPHRRLLACSCAILLPFLASGATLTWDTNSSAAGAQGGTGTWLAASRWLDGATNKTWISGSDAIFGGTAGTVTLGSNTSVGDITFNSSYTINGAGVLTIPNTTFSSFTVASGVTATMAVDITSAGATLFQKEGNGTLALSGSITSSGNGPSLSILAGTVRLDAGAASNGSVSVSSGTTLQVQGTASIAALSGNGSVTLNAVLSFPATVARTTTFSGNISGSGGLVFGSNGVGGLTQTLSGNNTFTGGLDVRSATLILGSATALPSTVAVTQSGGRIDLDGRDFSFASLSGTNFSGSFPGKIDLSSATLTVGSSNTSTSYAGSLEGDDSILRKVGTGTLTLTGISSTFTGATEINAGTLSVADLDATGFVGPLGTSGAVALGTASTNGTLRYTGDTATASRPLTLTGTLSSIEISTAATDLTWSGVVSGSGTLRKLGAGRLALSTSNTATGPVSIEAGPLRLANGAALSNAGTVTLSNVATAALELSTNATIRGLAGGGTTGGNVVLSTRSLTIDQDSNTTYSGIISGTGGTGISFTKRGTGILTLSGTNAFTHDLRIEEGTVSVGTVSNSGTSSQLGAGSAITLGGLTTRGTLRYTGPSATFSRAITTSLGGSALNIQLAATRLDFTGTIGGSGSFVKQGGGTFAPSGTLGFAGSLTIEDGTWEASSWADSGTASGIGAGGSVTLGAGTSLGTLRYTGASSSSNRTLTIAGQGEVELSNAAATLTLSSGLAGPGTLLRKDGPGTLVLGGDASYTGSIQILAGTLRLSSIAALDSVSGIQLTNSAGVHIDLADVPTGSYILPNLTGNAPAGLGLSLGAENATLLQTAPTTLLATISGTNPNATLTKSGPETFTITGSNTFQQALHIAEGTLSVATVNNPANAGTLGASTSITLGTATTHGTFRFTGGTATNLRTLSIPGAGGGTIEVTGGTLTQSGSVSGSGPLVKTGVGTLILPTANPFTSPVTIQGGTLTLSAPDALSQSSLVTVESIALLNVAADASLVAIAGDGIVALGTNSLTLTGAANATLGGLLTGSASAKNFVKRGGGTLTITNFGNSFTQGILIENGAISVTSLRDIGQTSALGSGSSIAFGALGTQGTLLYTGPTQSSNRPMTLNFGGGVIDVSNAASQLTLGGAIGGTGNLVKAGPGRLVLQGTNTFAGNMLSQGGTLAAASIADAGTASSLGSGSLVALAPGAQFTFLGVEAAPASTNRTFLIDGGGTIETAAELTLRTGLAGTGELRKLGADRLILSGAATFDGTLSIDDGTLTLAKSDAAASADLVEFDGPGILELQVSSILNRLRSGSSPGRVKLGASTLTLQIPTGGVASQFSGTIEGTGSVIKTDAGTLTLSGASSTFTGGVEIREGLVVIPDLANTGLPSSLGGGGAITLGGGSTAGILQFTGTNATTNRPFITSGGGGQLLITNAAAIVSLNGGISGTAQFTKSGAGRLTLGGNSTLTGRLQVGQGELRLNGILSAGPGSLDINPSARLSGGGTANRPVSVQGQLAPIGTLTTGSLTMQGGSLLILAIDSPTSFDRISSNGTVTLDGTVSLSLTLNYDPVDFIDSFSILLNDGSDPIGGRFSFAGNLLAEGSRFTFGGQLFEMRYTGGDGNDATLIAIPEPNTTLQALLISATLLGLRRRPPTSPSKPRRAG